MPWASNLLTELQRERKERLFSLVDPHHVLQHVQFGHDLDKDVKFWSKEPRPVEQPVDGIAADAFVEVCIVWRLCPSLGHMSDAHEAM